MATLASIKQTIAAAAQHRHTILITAKEDDGTVETREAEPYSYRITGGSEKFFCYDIARHGIRNFHLSKIIAVTETEHYFKPKWRVEL